MIKDTITMPSESLSPSYARTGDTTLLSGTVLVNLARDVLARGQPLRFSAPGTSMSPFIRDGDVITLIPFTSESVRIGDVVAFVTAETERLIVHRVVANLKDGCRIRGDNASEDDGVVPHRLILGTVKRVERGNRFVRFGLGPERIVIAILSRLGRLSRIVGAGRIIYSVVGRF